MPTWNVLHFLGNLASFTSMCGSKNTARLFEGGELKKIVLERIWMGRGGFWGLVRVWKD